MFDWLTNPEVLRPMFFVLLSIPVAGLLIWTVFCAGSAGQMRATSENLLILLCFSSLGVIVGVLAASSDTSAIAPLLPAVLSLVGGIATYLVSRETPEGKAPGDRLLIAAAVTALALTLFIGVLIGADMRHRADAYRESAAYKKYLIDIKREVDAYEKSRALTDAVPDPVKTLDQVLAEIERREKAK
jgi:hypothetical protein